MPEITFIIRFAHREPTDIPEVIEYTSLDAAWQAARLFAEPESSEIYTRIDLIAHNWAEGTESVIFSMTFAEPYSF